MAATTVSPKTARDCQMLSQMLWIYSYAQGLLNVMDFFRRLRDCQMLWISSSTSTGGGEVGRYLPSANLLERNYHPLKKSKPKLNEFKRRG